MGLAITAWGGIPSLGPRGYAADRAPTAADIDRAVRQLGDREYTVRQRASQVLWEAGRAAEPALQKALDSDDLEVVYRARQILDQLQWGILPDTPPGDVAWIERFRHADSQERRQICQELSAAGGSSLLRRLIALEPDKAQWKLLAQQFLRSDDVLNRTLAEQAARFLLDGKFDDAERMLLDSSEEAALRDYAALLLARGKIDAKIAELRKQLERQSRSDYDGYRRLAYLLRAKGDAAAAVAAAERTSDGTFVDNLMVEAGQWAAVARMKAKAMAEDPPDDDPSRISRNLASWPLFSNWRDKKRRSRNRRPKSSRFAGNTPSNRGPAPRRS